MEDDEENHDSVAATPKLEKNQRTLFSFFKGNPRPKQDAVIPAKVRENGCDAEEGGKRRRRKPSHGSDKDRVQSEAEKSPVKKRPKEDQPVENGVEEDAGEPPVVPASGGRSIRGFFSAVSKQQFLEKARQEAERKVIEVRAQVHSPVPGAPANGEPKSYDAEEESVRRKHRSGSSCAVECDGRLEVLEEVVVVDGKEVKNDGHNVSSEKENFVEGSEAAENGTSRAVNGKEEPVKVSKKLFCRRAAKKSNDVQILRAEEDVSVDFDFPKKKPVTPSKPAETKPSEEEEESPDLFKNRPVKNKISRSRASKRKAPVNNYDSDSLDIEVLSKIADKSSSRRAEELDPSHLPFTALIEKPLVPSYVGGKSVPKKDDEGSVRQETHLPEDAKHKEVEVPSKTVVAPENNAFMLLMSKERKKRTESEVAEPEPMEVLEVEQVNATPPGTPTARKRGRPKKSRVMNKEAFLDNTESPSNGVVQESAIEQVKNVDANETGRRSSSRLQKKRSMEEQLRKERDELDAICRAAEEDAPKTKKRGRKSAKIMVREEGDDEDEEVRIEDVVIKTPPRQSPARRSKGKLAPIFLTRKERQEAARSVQPAEDPEKVAARQAFLQSSVPESVRAQMTVAALQREEEENRPLLPQFSSIGHIRQAQEDIVRPDRKRLMLQTVGDAEPLISSDGSKPLNNKVSKSCEEEGAHQKFPLSSPKRMSSQQIYQFVRSLQMAGDNFPVSKLFRRFIERRLDSDTLEEEAFKKNLNMNKLEETRMLRGGRRRHRSKKDKKEGELKRVDFDPARKSSMLWTMKYAPSCSDDIIGNAGVVKEIKSWLEGWTVGRKSSKGNRGKGAQRAGKKADDSFIVTSSEDSDSDFPYSSDDDDEERLADNTALLLGPNGVGKTASVYALATELGFKVLEVNASSCRGGKHVMSQLQEATQSHHLGKHKSKTPANLGKDPLKKGKKQSNSAPASTSLNRTALILFEDIDLVFGEQDEGFYSAVAGLIATTKRPIVLTSSDPNFVPKRLMRGAEPRIFRFQPISPSKAARNLQLLCLSEGFPVERTSLECVLSRRKGSLAPSILDLQYLAQSGPSITEVVDYNSDDECLTSPIRRKAKPLRDEDSEMSDSDSMETSLAKLIGVGLNLNHECQPVRLFTTCLADIIGANNASFNLTATSFLTKLFEDGAESRQLFESSMLHLLPLRRCHVQEIPRKRFAASAEAIKEYRRIKTFDFLQQSSDESDASQSAGEGILNDNDKTKVSCNHTNKSAGERKIIKQALDAIVPCTEIRSQLCCYLIEDGNQYQDEISLLTRLGSLEASSKLIASLVDSGEVEKELTVDVTARDAFSGTLAGAYRDLRRCKEEEDGRQRFDAAQRSAMDAILDVGSQLTPRSHFTETLPTLRAIARLEGVRRSSGDFKRSRSGRFLHYLESEEIYLEGSCLNSLCDMLL